MNIKALSLSLVAGLLSFGVHAQHETLQELPSDVDLSSAEITADYLKSELGAEFVSNVFGGQIACNTNSNTISILGEQVAFDDNPDNRFVMKVMEHNDADSVNADGRKNIGEINGVVLDPVLSAGMYTQRTKTYGEYCRKFESPNLLQHVNANTILASWIYSKRDSL